MHTNLTLRRNRPWPAPLREALAHLKAGRLDDADRLLAPSPSEPDSKAGVREGLVGFHRAVIAWIRGRYREGEDLARASVDLLRTPDADRDPHSGSDARGWLFHCCHLWAEHLERLGRRAEACTITDDLWPEALALLEDPPPGTAQDTVDDAALLLAGHVGRHLSPDTAAGLIPLLERLAPCMEGTRSCVSPGLRHHGHRSNLAVCLMAADRHQEALDHLLRVHGLMHADGAASPEDVRRLRAVRLDCLLELLQSAGTEDGVSAVRRRVREWERLEDDPSERAVLAGLEIRGLSMRAQALAKDGDLDAAWELGGRALALLGAASDRTAASAAHHAMALIAVQRHDPRRARLHLELAVQANPGLLAEVSPDSPLASLAAEVEPPREGEQDDPHGSPAWRKAMNLLEQADAGLRAGGEACDLEEVERLLGPELDAPWLAFDSLHDKLLHDALNAPAGRPARLGPAWVYWVIRSRRQAAAEDWTGALRSAQEAVSRCPMSWAPAQVRLSLLHREQDWPEWLAALREAQGRALVGGLWGRVFLEFGRFLAGQGWGEEAHGVLLWADRWLPEGEARPLLYEMLKKHASPPDEHGLLGKGLETLVAWGFTLLPPKAWAEQRFALARMFFDARQEKMAADLCQTALDLLPAWATTAQDELALEGLLIQVEAYCQHLEHLRAEGRHKEYVPCGVAALHCLDASLVREHRLRAKNPTDDSLPTDLAFRLHLRQTEILNNLTLAQLYLGNPAPWRAGEKALSILDELVSPGSEQAERRLRQRAEVLYNMACAHARHQHPEQALAYLEEAATLGSDDLRRQIPLDNDLASLRHTPRFLQLTNPPTSG